MRYLLLALCCCCFSFATAQHSTVFTQQDSLRGGITPQRAWWDLNFYHLDIRVEPDRKYIAGSNTIRYRVLAPATEMQIDLQPPLQIERITQDGQELTWNTIGNAHFLQLQKPQQVGALNELVIHYSGHPKEAVRAPWDGGFSWKKDANEKHFVATSCQGLGASVWWPNKDHMYDEVDSMAISVEVPKGLMDVSNGRLRSVEERDSTTIYHWFVANPINNYGVNVNIGDYVHFGEDYAGEKGKLDMDYYVLRDHLDTAKIHFSDARKMMQAFEHWFGPYPFYEDGFKLVEVPYLGMEHQSSVTYGNQFSKGYMGRDLSGTGWGLTFDFIIIHEAGHEWFANNITYRDIADMWIHEGFTSYSENLFLDYHSGTQAAEDYVIGLRKNIRNDRPIIGRYNVNHSGSGDMYYKGSNMLHTLRQLVDDDEQWRQILRGLNQDFYHQTVSSQEIEDYLSDKTGKDLRAFFDQYLRDTRIPQLEYQVKGRKITHRYTQVVEGFDMPIRLFIGEQPIWIYPSAEWQSSRLPKTKTKTVQVDRNFYVGTP